MKVLEKILQDIDNIKAGYNSGYDCIHKCTLYDRSVGTCIGNCEEYVKQEIKEILKNQLSDFDTESGWIPCKVRMPDRGERVLCYFQYEPDSPNVMCENVYLGSGIWESETDKVVAWMKSPDEYKPGE